jgi:hypothetical protein
MANITNFSVGSGPISREEIRAQQQIIEISPKPVTSRVVREGFEVPIVTLNKTASTFAIDNLAIVGPRFLPRVVSQSIPPGTKVTRGTVVDFVVVPKQDIPFDIFQNVHEALVGQGLTRVDSLVENVSVRNVLLKNETAADVTAADRAVLVTEFQKQGITVDDAQPGKTFEKAFESVRMAVAFR